MISRLARYRCFSMAARAASTLPVESAAKISRCSAMEATGFARIRSVAKRVR